MTRDALAASGSYDAITRGIPYNRKISDPMDIAAAALSLTCYASGMVDGHAPYVDGGRSVE